MDQLGHLESMILNIIGYGLISQQKVVLIQDTPKEIPHILMEYSSIHVINRDGLAHIKMVLKEFLKDVC